MANIRIRPALYRIGAMLSRIRTHIHQHSGVGSESEARAIESEATAIVEVATQIIAMAREGQGNRSHKGLLKKVRKALGFTYP